tara:strand:- start:76 stop:258 length:183 start_codon:yes stop_codon:yes gene_type:complete
MLIDVRYKKLADINPSNHFVKGWLPLGVACEDLKRKSVEKKQEPTIGNQTSNSFVRDSNL